MKYLRRNSESKKKRLSTFQYGMFFFGVQIRWLIRITTHMVGLPSSGLSFLLSELDSVSHFRFLWGCTTLRGTQVCRMGLWTRCSTGAGGRSGSEGLQSSFSISSSHSASQYSPLSLIWNYSAIFHYFIFHTSLLFQPHENNKFHHIR